MASTDTRQASRLRNLPQVPAYPVPPDLARVYAEHKTDGLTEVFRRFDQDNRDWARKVALTNQNAHRATIDAIPTAAGSSIVNAGWAVYDYVRREGTNSVTAQAYGRAVTIEPIEWRVSWLSAYGSAWLGSTGWSEVKYAKSVAAVAPRTFRIAFDESPLSTFRTIGRLAPQFFLIPGDRVLLPSGTIIQAVTDSVRVVSRRVGAGEYTCWLESAETVSPAALAELHVGMVLVVLT